MVGLLTSGEVLSESVLTLHVTAKAPLNTPDQSGFLDIICTKALSQVGYGLKTFSLPAERGLKNSNAGIDDGEMTRVAGLNTLYSNIIQVPEKIFDWKFVVFSKHDMALHSGWEGLAGRDVGFINGWKILEKNIPSSVYSVKVRTPEQLFEMLNKNRVDFIIYEYWSGMKFIEDPEFASIQPHSPPLMVEPMYIYLHQKHDRLVLPLAAAIQEMKQNGSYQRLYSQMLAAPARLEK